MRTVGESLSLGSETAQTTPPLPSHDKGHGKMGVGIGGVDGFAKIWFGDKGAFGLIHRIDKRDWQMGKVFAITTGER